MGEDIQITTAKKGKKSKILKCLESEIDGANRTQKNKKYQVSPIKNSNNNSKNNNEGRIILSNKEKCVMASREQW